MDWSLRLRREPRGYHGRVKYFSGYHVVSLPSLSGYHRWWMRGSHRHNVRYSFSKRQTMPRSCILFAVACLRVTEQGEQMVSVLILITVLCA